VELLSFIAQAAKRRESYIDRARDLAEVYSSLETLEGEMEERSEALVRRLQSDRITFSEFKRAAAEDTLVSSIAGLIIGSNGGEIDEVSYSSTMDQMKYLWRFFDDLRSSLDNGRLSEDSSEFEEEDEDDWFFLYIDEDGFPVRDGIVNGGQSGTFPKPVGLAIPVAGVAAAGAAVSAVKTGRDSVVSSVKSRQISIAAPITKAIQDAQKGIKTRAAPAGPATWKGVTSRLKRFLVTPLYRWFKTGEFSSMANIGMKEMRRISKDDRKVCYDCGYYHSLEWVPMGSLPMPGIQCRCHDRCRCRVEYR